MDSILTNKFYIYENKSLNKNIKGIIHISHGMAEHIKRYEWLTYKLNSDGFHVISIDHRGHGTWIKRGEIPGYFNRTDGWKTVVDDLEELIKITNNKYPNIKQYLLGHSMGSYVALSLIQRKVKLNGLILTGSSFISLNLIRLQKLIIQIETLLKKDKGISDFLDTMIIKSFNKNFKPNRTPKDWISTDEENVDNYVNDPLCGFKVTNNIWKNLADGLQTVFDQKFYKLANTSLPILIISGEKDPVGSNGQGPKKLRLFLSNIFNNVDAMIIKNCKHEVFSDIDKDIIYNSFLKFIKKSND